MFFYRSASPRWGPSLAHQLAPAAYQKNTRGFSAHKSSFFLNPPFFWKQKKCQGRLRFGFTSSTFLFFPSHPILHAPPKPRASSSLLRSVLRALLRRPLLISHLPSSPPPPLSSHPPEVVPVWPSLFGRPSVGGLSVVWSSSRSR